MIRAIAAMKIYTMLTAPRRINAVPAVGAKPPITMKVRANTVRNPKKWRNKRNAILNESIKRILFTQENPKQKSIAREIPNMFRIGTSYSVREVVIEPRMNIKTVK